MNDATIPLSNHPFKASLSPPPSKSLTNRAFILAALAAGKSTLRNVLFADDTRVMMESLRRLGFGLEIDEPSQTVAVAGHAGAIPAPAADLFCGNSGTTLRFLTALCTLGHGSYTLDGIPRMRQRPVAHLIDLLKNLGARITPLESPGYPPLRVDARGLPGGIARFAAAPSSQFLSAVLMVLPYARIESQVDLDPAQTSWPYVAMTMRLMDHFGALVELIRDPLTAEPRRIIIPREPYQPADYFIEPDASNATYFLALAAIHPGARITIEGLGKSSLQGDIAFADILHRMGADLVFGPDFITVIGTPRFEAIDVDMSPMPDAAQTLAVAALFAKGETTLRGLHTLRVKETDRIAALSNELTRLGARIHVEGDAMTITPPGSPRPASIATYDDHRMAMSFALAGTKAPGITIQDPACVNKTYPRFFEDLARVIASA